MRYVGYILHLGAQNKWAYAQILSNTNVENKGPPSDCMWLKRYPSEHGRCIGPPLKLLIGEILNSTATYQFHGHTHLPC